MDTDAKHHPLASLSPNKPLSPTKVPAGQDAQKSQAGFDGGADFHKQMLQVKLSEQKQGTYVSPSDDILSPCTQKLSALKGKRFASAGKPLSLFAKTAAKTPGTAEEENGFQDIKCTAESK